MLLLGAVCLPALARAQWTSQTISTGLDPWGIALNPMTNKIYVANQTGSGGHFVTEIDGTTGGAQQINLGTASAPRYVAVNPMTNRIYVLCTSAVTSYVVVVNGDTRAVVATIGIPAGQTVFPCAIAVNPATNRIYVAGYETGNVSVINGADNSVSHVSIGDNPIALGVNPNTNKIFVVKSKMNSSLIDGLAVLNGATNAVERTVTVGKMANCAAVSPDQNLVFVSNYADNTVTQVNANDWTTVTVAVHAYPLMVAVDNVGDANGPYAWVGYDTGNAITAIIQSPGHPPITADVTVGSAPHNLAIDQNRHLVYVSRRPQNTVSVVQWLDLKATCAVGGSPHQIVANPLTGSAYVVNTAPGTNTVSAIKGDVPGRRARPVLGGALYDVAYDPCARRVYVADFPGDRIVVWDPVLEQTVTTVPTGAGPIAVAVNPTNGKIYAACYNANSATIIDPSDWSTISVQVGSSPGAIAVNPHLNKIYVVNFQSNNVTVINGSNNSHVNIAVGAAPRALAINPVTDKVYVCNQADNTVTAIDGVTNSKVYVAVGSSPRRVAVDSGTNTIYVSNYSSYTVTYFNGVDLVTSEVMTGHEPLGLAVDPLRHKVYVANSGSGTCTVIDGITHATSTIYDLGIASPFAVDVSPHTDEIYLADMNSGFALIDGLSRTARSYSTDSSIQALEASCETKLGNAVFLCSAADGRFYQYANAYFSPTNPNHLTTSITSLPGNLSLSQTPSVAGTSSNARHPNNTNIAKVLFSLDDIKGPWKEAVITSGAGTTTVAWRADVVDPLNVGLHRIYAVALDASCGNLMGQSWSADSPFTGSIATMVFYMTPMIPPGVWFSSFNDGTTEGWTVTNHGATIAPDPVVFHSPPFSLGVHGASGMDEFATAVSDELDLDTSREYQISFRLRYTSFHWDQFLLFGHVRLLLDSPWLPLRYDPVGNYSYQPVPGATAWSDYLSPETWGLIRVTVFPQAQMYAISVNGFDLGTVSYLASVEPSRWIYLEDNPATNNFLNANYDDFEVGGYSTGPVAVGEPGTGRSTLLLEQNRPNPFSGITTFNYALPSDARVTLGVHDAGGRLLRTLVCGRQEAGWHRVSWRGDDQVGRPLPRGVYFCRLDCGLGAGVSRKVVVIR